MAGGSEPAARHFQSSKSKKYNEYKRQITGGCCSSGLNRQRGGGSFECLHENDPQAP